MLIRDMLFNDVFISHVSIRLVELSLPLIYDYDFKLECSPTTTFCKNSADKSRVLESITKIS